ncbi:TFIIS transcription elongation factor [Brazilian cedratvirus IHUMI]|uniref:TFIIS transcription elongation factor n=1 Tax=Brazilian cedratvirus IHUMI TaxID=2126980 RepID=A0A2R8FEC4_9VIRU|nr:TFIIS transcription elongation factor [Brazilian cedratvirus IHUMI]
MSRTLRTTRAKVSASSRRVTREEEFIPPTPTPKKRTLGNLSIEETDILRSLRFVDGTPLLTLSTTYELLAMIKEVGFAETLAFINSTTWDDSKSLILALPNLHSAREQVRREMLVSQEKLEASTGVHRCPYCQSMRTTTVEKQIRSCDEPTTQIVTCQDCGRQKRYG